MRVLPAVAPSRWISPKRERGLAVLADADRVARASAARSADARGGLRLERRERPRPGARLRVVPVAQLRGELRAATRDRTAARRCCDRRRADSQLRPRCSPAVRLARERRARRRRSHGASGNCRAIRASSQCAVHRRMPVVAAVERRRQRRAAGDVRIAPQRRARSCSDIPCARTRARARRNAVPRLRRAARTQRPVPGAPRALQGAQERQHLVRRAVGVRISSAPLQRTVRPSASSTRTSPKPSSRIGRSMTSRSPTTIQVRRDGSRASTAAACTAASVCVSMRSLSLRT